MRFQTSYTQTPFWLWLNLLSLDAPLVAIVWQDFLARCYPAVLRPAARWVLPLTVWAIYLADRLLDARHPAAANETVRHRFYRLRRVEAMALLGAVLLADLLTALFGLRPDVFANGLWIAGGVIVYLALFALWRIGVKRWKRPSAAILFTTGVFLVAWTRTANPASTLGLPAAAFCVLCLGNLVITEGWEQRAEPPGVAWMAVLAAVCAALGDSRWYAAVSVSALGLGLLNLLGEKLDRDARHVLADAVLLTPLLFR